ncbi:MAG: sigma-70 family RNA polymerase sigma factor [Chromatiales bacterium]
MWDKQSRFTALVHALSKDLYRYAYWLCHNRSEAEDLVQETFTRAWRSMDDLRDDKAAKGWLLTTLRREHARKYEKAQPDIEETDLALIQDPRRDYDCSTEAFSVRRALLRLPTEYREPLLLQVLEGYSCEEIASLMGLSPGAAMTRLCRARQRLREMLTDTRDTVTKVSDL